MISLLLQIIGLNAAVAWSPATNVDGYRLKIGNQPGVYTQTFQVPNTMCVIYIDQLNPLGNYYFRIFAFDVANVESTHSAEGCFTMPTDKPSLQLTSDGTLVFHWFKGGTFTAQQSSDLILWEDMFTLVATDDTYYFHVNMTEPKMFYRIKQDAWAMPKFADYQPVTAQKVLSRNLIPTLKELPRESKLSRWQKLRLFLKYRPGKHWDPSERFKR